MVVLNTVLSAAGLARDVLSCPRFPTVRISDTVCRTVSLCELFFGRSYFFGLEFYRMLIKTVGSRQIHRTAGEIDLRDAA